jgi:hypothetical protein
MKMKLATASLVLMVLILVLAVPMKPQTATPQVKTHTSERTGMNLVKDCSEHPPSMSSTVEKAVGEGYCIGLVSGVFTILSNTGHIHFTTFVSNGQMVLVVKKYLEEHPERLGEVDSTLIEEAFINAFPPTEVNRKRLSDSSCRPIF